MIVLINLFSSLDSIISRFRLFGSSKRLEHPIIVILTSIFLITWQTRLYRSFKFILFDFNLVRISFLCHQSSLLLVIVWSSSGVTFSRTHQPFIDFLVSFKDAFIIWSSIVWTKCPFLSYYEINFSYYWTISSRILSSWRGRFCLQLRILGIRGTWCLSSYAWNSCASSTWLF